MFILHAGVRRLPKAAAALSLAALAACSSAADTKSGGAGGGNTKMTIGYSIIAAPGVITWGVVDSGILAKHGVTGKLSYTASSTAVPALLSGDVDIAQVGGPDVVNAIASGAALTIVANVAPVHAYQLVVPNSVTSVQQLKGAKVGVSGPGTTSDIQTRIALRDLGLDPSHDVSYVNTSSSSNRVASLKSGAIKAAAMGASDALTLKPSGFHTLIDLAQKRAKGIDTVLAVSTRYLSAHKAQVQDYVDAFAATLAYERSNKAWTESEMTKYTKINDKSVLDQAYDQEFNQILPTNYPAPDLADFNEDLAILEPQNAKLKGFDPSKSVDGSLIQAAQSKKAAGN